MTTTDAEAIALDTALRMFNAELGRWLDSSDARLKDFTPLAQWQRVVSLLASRREAQEPVAWRDVERKFYHSDWPLTKLLEARNGGLLTDEGEAWTYVFSHKDGIGGEYDLLRRREPAPPSPAPAPAGEVERMREALEIIAGKRQCVDNLMSNADVARAALNGVRHD